MPASSGQRAAQPLAKTAWIAGTLLLVALLVGGGGTPAPAAELAVEVLAAGLVAGYALIAPPAHWRQLPRTALALAAVLIALPLLQLMPLPPFVWHALPGRGLERQALALIGAADSWQPWSMTPARTLAALLALAVPAAMLVLAALQDRRGRTLLLALAAGVGLLSLLVGAGQLSGGPDNAFRFYVGGSTFLNGFQANHNSEADLLLMAMIALAAVARDLAETRSAALNPRRAGALVLPLTLLLALGVVLTGSRSGIVLLLLAFGAQLLILRAWLPRAPRRLLPGMIVALALLGLTVALLWHNPTFARALARFRTLTEFRPEIWYDAAWLARQYLPAGAGLGSFIPLFGAAERLEVVSDRLTNRAHNDYLEFLIEAGVPGTVLLVVIGLVLARAAWRGWARPPAGSRAQYLCAIAGLTLFGVHSLIDYPLRSISLACMAALCASLLLPLRQSVEPVA